MTGPVPGPSERLMLGAKPRRLVVLRHGQTTHNADGVWQGQLDTELSEVGLRQAAAAAEALLDRQFSAIWSSDLKRAHATALSVAGDRPVRVDPRLREINVGLWQGRTMDDVRAHYGHELDAIATGDDVRRGETGETVSEVAQRASAAARDLIAQLDPGQSALIVSHGVAARALAAALVGIDLHAAWLGLAGLHNCHWVELAEGAHGWRIEKWNAAAPLSRDLP
ncbi:histidine phosphatase family protein [Calidifontibacter terrae]